MIEKRYAEGLLLGAILKIIMVVINPARNRAFKLGFKAVRYQKKKIDQLFDFSQLANTSGFFRYEPSDMLYE